MPAHDDAAAASAQRLGERLAANGQTIAVAESLTGGLLVQALARVEGSGDWLLGGVVAYHRRVKHAVLGVTAEIVVSAPAAAEMARGARRLLGADVAIAVTGAAGPDPQDGRPPGTVFVGIDTVEGPTTAQLALDGDPQEICARTVTEAIELAFGAI